MVFNKHEKLEGLHAPFSASKSSWLRYDDEHVMEAYQSMQAKVIGTKLHEWAKMTIDLGIKQPKSKKTLYAYVNDAIGYKMNTEVVLFYSKYFFGTADAISYRNNFLRIHDLKTGKTPAHVEQLLVYVALFCLEYHIKFSDLKGCEVRLYQNDEIFSYEPTVEDIVPIMDKIIHLDKILAQHNEEG